MHQITANIKNSTLEGGIKQVISLIGNPNYAIVKNDSVKKVEIKIFDAFPGFSSAETDSPANIDRKNLGEYLIRMLL